MNQNKTGTVLEGQKEQNVEKIRRKILLKVFNHYTGQTIPLKIPLKLENSFLLN